MKKLYRAFLDECTSFLHSRGVISIFIVGIFFYSVLYPVPYEHQVPQKLLLYAVDEDQSTSSRLLLRAIGATEGVRLVHNDNAPNSLAALQTGVSSAVLIIPKKFEYALLRGESAVIPLYSDAAHLLPYRMVLQGVRQAVENTGAGIRMERLQKRGVPDYAALQLQTSGLPDVRLLYNPAGSYSTNTVPPVFILILQQTLLIGSAMLSVRQRMTAPGTGSGNPLILLGRLLFIVCLYSLHAVYYLRILPAVDDLPLLPHFGETLLFLLPFFLACGGIGNTLGRFIREEALVLPVLLPTSLPFLFLSGFVWPPESMPALMRGAAQLLPSTPAITGYMLMAVRDVHLTAMLPLWGQLWGLAFAAFGFVCMLSRSDK